MAMIASNSIPPALRPLIRQQSFRFLSSRNFTVAGRKWRQTGSKNDSSLSRLADLHYHHSPPFYPLLSLRHPPLLPHSPLRSLLRSCSPPLRRSLMATAASPLPAASDSAPPNSTKTVRVVIKGRVQGVFYRDWTVQNARELGLKGWIRNRRDGSVEALFSGTSDLVHEMEQRCRQGPPGAMVTGLEVFPSSDNPGTGFERKSTV